MQNKVAYGVEEVKKLCRKGELPCKMTDGGHYKIEVYDDVVPREQYDKLKEEYLILKTMVQQFNKTTSSVV